MFIDCFLRTVIALQQTGLRTNRWAVHPIPHTEIEEGDEVDFTGDLTDYLILSPSGEVTGDLSALLSTWKRLLVQQKADAPYLCYRSRATKWVPQQKLRVNIDGQDTDLSMGDDEQELIPMLRRLALYMENLFGDPVIIKGYLYKGKTFYLTEVAPEFVYEGEQLNVWDSYVDLLDSGVITVEDFIQKMRVYLPYMPEFPKGDKRPDTKLAKRLQDHMQKQSGGYTYAGIIAPGHCILAGQKINPVGILYTLLKDQEVEEYSPTGVHHVLFNFHRDLVRAGRFQMVYRDQLEKIKSWKSKLFDIEIYLDGITHPAELRYYLQKMKCPYPVGVTISSWAQEKALAKGSLDDLVCGYLYDLDALCVDGHYVSLIEAAGGKLEIPTWWFEPEVKGFTTNPSLSRLLADRVGNLEVVFVGSENYTRQVLEFAVGRENGNGA